MKAFIFVRFVFCQRFHSKNTIWPTVISFDLVVIASNVFKETETVEKPIGIKKSLVENLVIYFYS